MNDRRTCQAQRDIEKALEAEFFATIQRNTQVGIILPRPELTSNRVHYRCVLKERVAQLYLPNKSCLL